MKLTSKQIKQLPRKVIFEVGNIHSSSWEGRSDGIIIDGLYLKVYPAYSSDNRYKSCNFINIPLNRIYSF
jgi:hypothetical protein